MNLHDYYLLFIKNLSDTSLAEVIAVATGLMSVWFAKKENILVYPVGIVSVAIYVFLCYSAGLYADMGINAFYFVMSIYGWIIWTLKNKENNKPRSISILSRSEAIFSIVITIALAVSLYFILIRFTDSSVPYLDSFTTAVFITGMYLMAVKKVENWIYWIVGDVICIFLFAYKGLVLSGFQYLVFFILAIAGLIEWRSRYKSSSN